MDEDGYVAKTNRVVGCCPTSSGITSHQAFPSLHSADTSGSFSISL